MVRRHSSKQKLMAGKREEVPRGSALRKMNAQLHDKASASKSVHETGLRVPVADKTLPRGSGRDGSNAKSRFCDTIVFGDGGIMHDVEQKRLRRNRRFMVEAEISHKLHLVTDPTTIQVTYRALRGGIAEEQSYVKVPAKAIKWYKVKAVPGGACFAPSLRLVEVPVRNTTPATKSEGSPSDTVITRRAAWWNRWLFDKEESKFDFSKRQNLKSGQLTVRKEQNGQLTVPEQCVLPELYNYLRVQKFHKYEKRDQCVDHMMKLARKYWQENKIEFSKISDKQANLMFATVQKVVDETDTGFLLAHESQALERSRLIVSVRERLEKAGLRRSNMSHF